MAPRSSKNTGCLSILAIAAANLRDYQYSARYLTFAPNSVAVMSKKDIELDNELDDSAEGSEELYERMNLVVDRGQEPMRLDKFLVQRIENASRNKVQQAI